MHSSTGHGLETEGADDMEIQQMHKRAYVAPRIVDFGSIDVMTGDCLGLCLDAINAGFYGMWPPG